MTSSAERLVRNPVLPGFHPDPAMIHVDGDFLVATSTFQWYPGVALHRSGDLVHWERLPHPLHAPALDLLGVPDSGGIWAPDLSYVDGVYHLVYTVVRSYSVDGFYDCPNFHVQAPSPYGPWSPPVPLHARGFDPSLYHEGGRSYLLSMEWDHRPGRRGFAGILLQEFDRAGRRLTGRVHRVFDGTSLGITEGPRLYHRAGWYYLVTAEGGTGTEHAVTVARSPHLTGPFHADPKGPLLTSAGHPRLPLWKAGHGCLAEDGAGDWYLAHLTARPTTEDGRCVLGRETAVQQVVWAADGWPRVADGLPVTEFVAPGPVRPLPPEPVTDDFDAAELAPCWQSVRRPPEESWLSLGERPGWLRLRAGESPASAHKVSLLARRQTAHDCEFTVLLDTSPGHFQQLAGLIHYYDRTLWHWLHLTHDEEAGRCLRVLTSDRGVLRDPTPVPLPWPSGPVWLRATVQRAELRFSASRDGVRYTGVGPVLDASILSDEYAATAPRAEGTPVMGFTGAFLGVCATDLTGARLVCDVDRMSLSNVQPGH
ncbi:xylan 1,4-beta-xylosidase [Crossiella equi]|uniref:Xylan 1,4-beta-xylosidase n=1 Tax=Crossiella equi TaxID=130796 RepID=A0ABS5A689_9PSEU|nr:glycoside hydrolase family 43 protein [Crossiella equi]MBP2472109.1 xylan 1,4-beta-xylosidase [Crossiella equi]